VGGQPGAHHLGAVHLDVVLPGKDHVGLTESLAGNSRAVPRSHGWTDNKGTLTTPPRAAVGSPGRLSVGGRQV
jgi:hypothetical protein